MEEYSDRNKDKEWEQEAQEESVPLALPPSVDEILLHLDEPPNKKRGRGGLIWGVLMTGAFLLCLGMLLASLAGTRAQEDSSHTASQTDGAESLPVGEVETDRIIFVREDDTGLPTAQQIYDQAGRGVVCLSDENGRVFGGFLFASGGYIATTAQGLGKCENPTVQLRDGEKLTASVVACHAAADLALLKIEKSELGVLPLGKSQSLLTGDRIYTIGAPHPSLTGSFFEGRVACSSREISVLSEDLTPEKTVIRIQISPSLASSLAGSPLLDEQGSVVGILTSDASMVIPMDGAAPILQAMLRGESISTALLSAVTIPAADLGIVGEAARDEESGICGVRIREIGPNATDTLLKLAVGDLITHLEGEAVTSAASLQAKLRGKRPEERVSVTVYRAGQSLTFFVELVTIS